MTSTVEKPVSAYEQKRFQEMIDWHHKVRIPAEENEVLCEALIDAICMEREAQGSKSVWVTTDRQDGTLPNYGEASTTVWKSTHKTSGSSLGVVLNRPLVDLINSNGIYKINEYSAKDLYYFEIFVDGRVLLKYQQILGSKLVLKMSADQMAALDEKASNLVQMKFKDLFKDVGTTHSARIPVDVLTVLRAGTVDGDKFYLPKAQLDSKLYKRVNEVLQILGGKWKGGKTVAHVFEGPADEAIAVALATGDYTKPQDFGFFPTQPPEVERVIALAEIEPGMMVLEPSAGDGRLANAAAKIVGKENVVLYEFLPKNVASLQDQGYESVTMGDFLAVPAEPLFDRIIMNPPFGNMADAKHVQHAARFLKPDGVLVAITGTSYSVNSNKKAAEFREFIADCEGVVETIDAGAFKAAGTNVATHLIKFEAANFPWNRAEKFIERQRT